jgi:tetratricopeptide (TPR) repeat protein
MVKDLEQVAQQALDLAPVDPARAQILALSVESEAGPRHIWIAVSMAKRALGVASLALFDPATAVISLREAVAAGKRSRSVQRTAEARMSLASALVLTGKPAQAFREIEAALAGLDGLAAARALTQRSAILQEMGRLEDALEDLRRALPVLRRAGDANWEWQALSNRSLIFITRRAFAAAEADLVAARQLCVQLGSELRATVVEQNLGCLMASRGDVPAALHHFDLAEAGFRHLTMEAGSLLVDRAELLLSVRLLTEARATAEAAVGAYQRQGQDNHLPEARLLLSTVALVQGDVATARAAADQAVREFSRLGRRESVALARSSQLLAQLADDTRRPVSPAQARRTADELAAAGWAVPALEARVLAGRLALQRGQRAAARRDLESASRARYAGPAELRARAWLAEALLRKADGRRRGAVAALDAGLRIIEDHRATLGATELRAHVSVHRGSLARLGLRMALEDRHPGRVLTWVERGRASATLMRPAHPPEDSVLARDLADLRATMTEIGERRGAALPTTTLVGRQVALERRIRDRCRTVPGGAGTLAARPPSIGALTATLGDAALVDYVELDEVLHAVTVVAGRARLHHLGPVAPVRQALAHLPFALHRLADRRTRASSRAAAEMVVTRAGAVFEQTLLHPLRRELQDRELVIAPTGALQSLPWSILDSCADRPVTVTPSATLWHVAAHRPRPASGAPIVVIAGPGLPGAQGEAIAIARLHPGARCLTDAAADAAGVSAAMSGAAIVHIAAHGCIRSDNPLFSSLSLADGPFTVYDIERLKAAPHHVVLAACDTGRPHVVAGEEVLGLAAALLTGGTAMLIAPVVPVPDVETAPLMQAYHERLRAGCSPAQALVRAQVEVRRGDPLAGAAASGFVCLGAGLAPLFPAAAVPAQRSQAQRSQTDADIHLADPARIHLPQVEPHALAGDVSATPALASVGRRRQP